MEETRVIRRQLNFADVKFKADAPSRPVVKAMKTLHTMELMAINIYKFQLTKKKDELNRYIMAAMCNEMAHFQDFQVGLYEHGLRPAIQRAAFFIVGFVFGFGSRLLGRKMMLKTGIWVEKKAVRHYNKLLTSADFDEATRKMIEDNRNDEIIHIENWEMFLKQF